MAEAPDGRRWTLFVAIAVIAVLAMAAAVVVAWDNADDPGPGSSASGVAVPSAVLSGSGTELGDGLSVAEGSSLIGPRVVTSTDDAGELRQWFALVLVEDDPVAVWEAYAEQLSVVLPDAGVDPSQAPGCIPGDDNLDFGEACHIEAHNAQREIGMSLRSVPGDVTGHYLLLLYAGVWDPTYGGDEEIAAGLDELPEPSRARERPGVGDPLAPMTTAYEGDDEEYVLVEGSELLAQYGAGSITGGFDVMLRVRPDADLDAVVAAYIQQANQYDDPSEETPPPAVTEYEGTTVSDYSPPGGAGGYTGSVTVVDRPEGDDYIFFALSND